MRTALSRRHIAILGSVVLIILLTSLASVSAQEPTVFRVGTEAPVDLDPATGSNDPETLFNRLIYDYLVDINAAGELVPNLATGWTVSENGLVYTFNLRQGVTFHDGSPFTAADVVFTFNRLKEISSPATGLLGSDFTVNAVDDHSVVFVLPAPNADFLFGVASRFALILKDGTTNPNQLDESGANPYANFNGTGAFILTEYRAGERAVFSKNENYWLEGAPGVDQIELIFIPDTLGQIDAFRSGTVDFIFKLPINQIGTFEAEEGVTVIEQPTNRHPVIRLRADEGFAGEDVRVRQALKHATDRELLNLDVENGLGAVGNNDPIGPAYGPFFTPVEGPEYSPERACELIGEAGYTDENGNPRLELTFYVVDAFNYPELATALQQQWEQGCIYVEILVREGGVYYAGDPGEWLEVELGLTGWGHRETPQAYLQEAYISGGIYNESHWSNPQIDALTAQAAATADIDARKAIYAQISEIFAQEGPILIPYFGSIIGVTRDNIQGLEINPFPGRTDLRFVTINQ